MSILDQVTDRLRRGLAVEIVRDRQRRLRVYRPQPADFYELPKGANADRRILPTALPVCRAVAGEHETYTVEYIGHRPSGDVDAVVSATPHDHRAPTYLAFRRCGGTWRPLAGRDQDLASAVHRAEHGTRWAGWDNPELTALLNTVEPS